MLWKNGEESKLIAWAAGVGRAALGFRVGGIGRRGRLGEEGGESAEVVKPEFRSLAALAPHLALHDVGDDVVGVPERDSAEVLPGSNAELPPRAARLGRPLRVELSRIRGSARVMAGGPCEVLA